MAFVKKCMQLAWSYNYKNARIIFQSQYIYMWYEDNAGLEIRQKRTKSVQNAYQSKQHLKMFVLAKDKI